jgi:hypothetical protein
MTVAAVKDLLPCDKLADIADPNSREQSPGKSIAPNDPGQCDRNVSAANRRAGMCVVRIEGPERVRLNSDLADTRIAPGGDSLRGRIGGKAG